MWAGLDLIPHSPTLIEGEKYHPELIKKLMALGERYQEAGGVLVISPHFYEENAFPVNPEDPIPETLDWEGFYGFRPRTMRMWDGIPFLAEALRRVAKRFGVPTIIRPGPLDHGIWTPLRWIFPDFPMPVLPVGVCGMGASVHYQMGRAIRQTVLEVPKPVVVFLSLNLTHRPDWIRWDKKDFPPEGQEVDQAILKALKGGDWTPVEKLTRKTLERATPEGGKNLWALLRGLTEGLKGEVLHYESALGAFGMALVHFEPQVKEMAA
jgi:aromatic ring-opening dioxygenase catalytic subunit (LigB family)